MALAVGTLGWVGAQVANVLLQVGASVIDGFIPDFGHVKVATWTHHVDVASSVCCLVSALALVVLIRRVGLTVRR